jgi:cytoskeleton protein RodZ
MNEPEMSTATGIPQTGVGGRLRQARTAQNIALVTVAEHLHMTVGVVTALEQDDYTKLPTRVFVRGYIRNYARLVNEPVDDILAEFDQAWPPTEQPMKIQLPPRLAADTHPKHRWRQIVTWLILLLGTLLFLLWWQGYLSQVWQQRIQLSASVSQESDLLVPPIPVPVSEQQPINQASVLAAPDQQPASSPEPDDTPQEVGNTPATPPEPEPENTMLAEDPAAEDGELVVAAPVVTIRFNRVSWVNIRDHSGAYQLTGRMTAGEQHQFGGEAPYQLVIGNAAAVELSIDGQPYDLSPHIRSNVARFTLTTP